MEYYHTQLPLELIDQIMRQVIISFDHDPAYQWSTLRHISARYMYMIEQYFKTFWLPKLCITANHTAWYMYDYHFDEETCLNPAFALGLDNNVQKNKIVWFRIKQSVEYLMAGCMGRWNIKEVLNNLWHDYSFSNKKVFLRLGEGEPIFVKGPSGGYLINDTDLPDLEVEESGLRIKFNWKLMFECFFREEMMMRDRQNKLKEAVKVDLKKRNEWPNNAPLVDQIRTLLPSLVVRIQQDRRFHVQMHRSLRHDPSSQTMSSYLSEPVTLVDSFDIEGVVDPFERQVQVTLFEAVGREEYMVLTIPEWRELDKNILLQLCAEEYGWRCYFFSARRKAKDQEWRFEKEVGYLNFNKKYPVTWGSENRWYPPYLI